MKHRIFIGIISIALCITLLFGTASFAFAAEAGPRVYQRLADLDEITATYLSDSEERAAQYPTGAIMIAETSAELEMKHCYAIDILRQGGTKGEAKIKLSTVDMTAGYGEDYRLYLTDERSDKGVDGEKKLYYYESGVPYIARLSDHEEYYMTKESVDDLDAAQKEASEINDMAAQADVMNPNVPDVDPFYINYGGIEIPEINVGSSVELSFVSDDIPERIFDKYGTNTANLRLAITPKDGIGWSEVKGNEPYSFIDELGIGQFVKPVPKEIASVSAEPVTMSLGSERFIVPKVTPISASSETVFTYSTKDDSIITVDGNSLVKGIAPGTGVVTVSCGSVSTEVGITVTAGDLLLGDADLDGTVDVADATTVQRYDARMIDLTGAAEILADVDRDGEVSIIDATWIQRYDLDMKAPEGIGKPITNQ